MFGMRAHPSSDPERRKTEAADFHETCCLIEADTENISRSDWESAVAS